MPPGMTCQSLSRCALPRSARLPHAKYGIAWYLVRTNRLNMPTCPCTIYSHCRLRSSYCACAAAEPVLRERGVCPQRRRQQICDPQPAHEGTKLSTVEAALRDHLTSSLRSRLRLRITCLQLLQLPAPLPQPPGRAASVTELPPWYSPLLLH